MKVSPYGLNLGSRILLATRYSLYLCHHTEQVAPQKVRQTDWIARH
jgi:hypothetical protein